MWIVRTLPALATPGAPFEYAARVRIAIATLFANGEPRSLSIANRTTSRNLENHHKRIDAVLPKLRARIRRPVERRNSRSYSGIPTDHFLVFGARTSRPSCHASAINMSMVERFASN